MRDIVVAMPSHTGLSDLAKAFEESPFEVIGPSEGRLVIRLDDEVVQFLHDQSLFEHYEEPNELTLLNSLGSHPNFFS
ncbi:hypothetical protein EH244_31250 [Variovorax beijingensis]|uniref:Uncharacterized protein n=1 Tax=Variovorax beijingensis TaxID=2496117 RepID=A0A3P3E0N2_9BURK|nr:hypothetical protein [Variovorax beijingensis]RRH79949.1 hypothetical protein EH244_31250 [Variovorax beijingensis]